MTTSTPSATITAGTTAVSHDDQDRPLRLALFASIAISFLAASAAPTPLYQHYDLAWHGSALTTTEAFGVYAGAVLVGLLLLGELANHVGRRPVLYAALALQAVAVLLFASAGSFAPLFAGRIVQGIAAGAALGTLGAAMIESHRRHGTVASAAAPAAGTGIGALAAGLAVGYLPWPTHLIYLSLLAVFAVQALGVHTLVASNPTTPGALASMRPRLAVPTTARRAFLASAPAVFAVWALAGLYGSLGPAVVRTMAPNANVALGGIALFVLASFGSLTTVARRDHEGRAQMVGGMVALIVGAVATGAAVETQTLWAFLLATAVSGIGFGSGLQGAIRHTVSLAEPSERAGLLSAIYLVSYAGMGAPAVVAGFLVSRGAALTPVTVGYAGALVVLALIALAQLAAGRRTA